MGNVNYDSTLDFGTLDLAGSDTEFPNVINLGETEANRKTVDVLVSADAAGGSALTLTVEGSADGAAPWTGVGANTITLEDLLEGKGAVSVSPNSFRHIRVAIAKTGGFTAGTAAAQLNTYAGK